MKPRSPVVSQEAQTSNAHWRQSSFYPQAVPVGRLAASVASTGSMGAVSGKAPCFAWAGGWIRLPHLTSVKVFANAPSPYTSGYGCWQYDDFGNRTQEAYSTTYSNPCSSESYANAQWTVTTPCVPPIYNPHNT